MPCPFSVDGGLRLSPKPPTPRAVPAYPGRPSTTRSLQRLSEDACPRHELGGDADLLGRRAEGLSGLVLANPLHLVHDAARLHHGHPFLGVPLAFSHPRLGWFLGDGLVREDPDPHLAPPLEAAAEGHSRRLDLSIRDPARFQRLETVLAKGESRASLSLPLHAPTLGLAVLDALGHQHGKALTPPGAPCPGLRP